jgi:LysM repeat protein
VTITDDADPAKGEAPRGEARRPDGGATEPPIETTPDPSPVPPLERPIETTPAPPTPRPSPPAGPVHVVRPGDTLIQIAAWHRVELTPIVTWNPTADPRRLVSGQRILIPGGAPMPAATPALVVAPAPTSAAPDPSAAPSAAPAPAAEVSGHLWPLPVKGILTRPFSSAHPGIDVAAPAGTSVRAIASGTVVWAGWRTNGGGYVIVIDHPDGMTSTYNHNQGVDVSVRQVVAVGEVIARVGATGWATGPHLDLRIEMGGRLIDPLRLSWAR